MKQLDEPWVQNLNDALHNTIERHCENKKLLLTLTGGMDTRTLLSILLNKGYYCDTFTYVSSKKQVHYFVKKDLAIAKKLSSRYNLHHIVLKGNSNWGDDGLKEIRKGYDVVLGGGAMTEYLDMFEYNKDSMHSINENKLGKRIQSIKKNNIFCPILSEEVQKIIPYIPICYRMFSIIQRQVILLNKPELLRFGYTEHSILTEIESRMYRFLILHKRLI